MGEKGTSQSAALDRGSDTKKHGYDLLSWQGVAAALKDGRDYLKDPVAYAEFRNLVLEYSRGGGDSETRAKLDGIISKFESSGQTPAPQAQPPKKKKRKKKKRHEAKQQTPAESVPAPQAPPAPVQPEAAPTKPSTPIVGRTRATPQFVPKSVAPTSEPEPTPEPVSPKAKPQTVAPREVPEFIPTEEHKRRIAEIKRHVREQFGNPATLIDTRNDVGKTYMSALLTALKAVAPGSSLSIEKSMQGLEDAYAALLSSNPDKEKTTEPIEEKVKLEDVVVEKTEKKPVSEKKEEVLSNESAPKKETRTETSIPLADTKLPQSNQDTEEKRSRILDALVRDREEPQTSPAPSTPTPTQELPAEPVPTGGSENLAAEIGEMLDDLSEEVANIEIKEPAHEEQSISPKKEMPVEKEVAEEPSVEIEKAPVSTERTPILERIITQDTPEIPASAPKEKVEPASVEEPAEKEKTPVLEVTAPDLPPIVAASPEPVKEAVEKEETLPPPQKPKKKKKKKRKKESSTQTPSKSTYVEKMETNTPLPGSIKTRAQQSELSSSEVTDALKKLLDEWTLFGGSGLLGLGPGGVEHPLYQKLSMLSMGEVLAGRWEKADAKTLRIIKDYVDAWRHEQGIAYTINETFEHYLRRVVQRILRRQKEG